VSNIDEGKKLVEDARKYITDVALMNDVFLRTAYYKCGQLGIFEGDMYIVFTKLLYDERERLIKQVYDLLHDNYKVI
jgi:hypothetical protein